MRIKLRGNTLFRLLLASEIALIEILVFFDLSTKDIVADSIYFLSAILVYLSFYQQKEANRIINDRENRKNTIDIFIREISYINDLIDLLVVLDYEDNGDIKNVYEGQKALSYKFNSFFKKNKYSNLALSILNWEELRNVSIYIDNLYMSIERSNLASKEKRYLSREINKVMDKYSLRSNMTQLCQCCGVYYFSCNMEENFISNKGSENITLEELKDKIRIGESSYYAMMRVIGGYRKNDIVDPVLGRRY